MPRTRRRAETALVEGAKASASAHGGGWAAAIVAVMPASMSVLRSGGRSITRFRETGRAGRCFRFVAAAPIRPLVIRVLVPLALCAALALAVVGRAAAEEEPRPGLGDRERLRSGGEPGGRSGQRSRRRRRRAYARFSPPVVQRVPGDVASRRGRSPRRGSRSGPRAGDSQGGWTFGLDQPRGRSAKQVRGYAEVQWREGGGSTARPAWPRRMPSHVGGSAAECALS